MTRVTYEIRHKYEVHPPRIVTVSDDNPTGREIIQHLREAGKLHAGALFTEAGCKVIEVEEAQE